MRTVSILGHSVGLSFPPLSPIERILTRRGFRVIVEHEVPDNSKLFRVEGSSGQYSLYFGETILARHQTPKLVCELLIAQCHELIANEFNDFTFVRGAAVCLPTGHGLILAGGDFSGQTTLANALVAAGASLVSEHFVVVDDDGRIVRYPSISYQPETFPADGVVRLNYKYRSSWQAESVSAGRLVLLLMPLVSCLNEQNASETMCRLSKLTSTAKLALFGERGEADKAATALLQHFETAGR